MTFIFTWALKKPPDHLITPMLLNCTEMMFLLSCSCGGNTVRTSVQTSLLPAMDSSSSLDVSKPTVRYNASSGTWVCLRVSDQWDVPEISLLGAYQEASLELDLVEQRLYSEVLPDPHPFKESKPLSVSLISTACSHNCIFRSLHTAPDHRWGQGRRLTSKQRTSFTNWAPVSPPQTGRKTVTLLTPPYCQSHALSSLLYKIPRFSNISSLTWRKCLGDNHGLTQMRK